MKKFLIFFLVFIIPYSSYGKEYDKNNAIADMKYSITSGSDMKKEFREGLKTTIVAFLTNRYPETYLNDFVRLNNDSVCIVEFTISYIDKLSFDEVAKITMEKRGDQVQDKMINEAIKSCLVFSVENSQEEN